MKIGEPIPTTPSASDLDRLAEEVDVCARALADHMAAPIRKLCRAFSRDLRTLPASIHAHALRLIEYPTLPHRCIACELIEHHPGARAIETVEALGTGIDNWWSVDIFAMHAAGPTWPRGAIPDRAIPPLGTIARSMAPPRHVGKHRPARQQGVWRHRRFRADAC